MMRLIRLSLATALAASIGFAATASAASYDMVVVQVENAPLKRGAVIDGYRALTLPEGSKVTLVGADGSTIKLKGPLTAKPAEKASRTRESESATGKVVEILGALLRDERRSSKALGVVRSANADASERPPHELAVNVAQSGTKCIGSEVAVFWRNDARHERKLEIRRVGSARSATAVWPEGQEFVAISGKAFRNGENYLVSVGGRSVQMKINVMPDGLNSMAEQAAWMAKSECRDQALAMVDRIR